MKEFKVKLDRKKLSKEHIESKQNFDSVLAQIKAIKAPFWKSAWFYGSIGLSGIAVVVGYSFIQNKEELHETINTQISSTNQIIEEDQVLDQSVIVAQIHEPLEVQKAIEKKIPNEKVEEVVAVKAISSIAADVLSNDKASVAELKDTKKVTTVISTMPSIDGVFNGDISIDRFSTGELKVGSDVKVTQFSIQYTSRNGDKTISVQGSEVPTEISNELKSVGLNQTVFITNVIAVNQSGDLLRCYSMDLNVKFK